MLVNPFTKPMSVLISYNYFEIEATAPDDLLLSYSLLYCQQKPF